MFTRSGKRAIASLESESINVNEVKTKRKTRSHKQTENDGVEGVSKKKHYVLRCTSEKEDNSEDTTGVQLRKRKSRRTTLKEVTNNVTDAPKPTKIKRHKVKTKDEHFPVTSQPICEKFEVDGKKLEKNSCGCIFIEEMNEHSHYEVSASKPTDSFDRGVCSNGNPEDLKPKIRISYILNDIQSDTVTKNAGSLVKEEKQDYIYLKTENIEQQETSHNNSAFNLLFDNNRRSRSSYKNSTFNEISTDTKKSTSYTVRKSSPVMLEDCNDATEVTSGKLNNDTYEKNKQNNTFNIKNTTSPIVDDSVNTPINTTYDKETGYINSIHNGENSKGKIKRGKRQKITPLKVSSVDKISNQSSSNPSITTEDELNEDNPNKQHTIDVTFDEDTVDDIFGKKAAEVNYTRNASIVNKKAELKTAFENLDTDIEGVSESSIITSDTSSRSEKLLSYISITSDDTTNIMNKTPLLLESSLEDSHVMHKSPNVSITNKPSPNNSNTIKPLKREGTFTKESVTPTPVTQLKASPGCTPFPSKSGVSKQPVLNVTRSIEKPHMLSVAEVPHTTRVMFCSPINTPMINNKIKGKVIKSSMKGSDKSFMFDTRVSGGTSGRKRTLTQGASDECGIKRQRTDTPISSCHSRSRSASGKIQNTLRKSTPANPNSESRISRKKMPNFAILHQKQFDKMESLDECQERKAKRAQMLAAGTSSAAKDNDSKADSKQVEKKHTIIPINSGYTRFGFKIKCDVNPFDNGAKNANTTSKVAAKPRGIPNAPKQQTLPSLAGTTARKEIAKQTVMREKSFAEKRAASRRENRTIIKGVRTNRRFDLQMQMRNINN